MNDRKMKVGIVTFQHANNYGALLQSYALQRSVKKLGCECEIIAYSSSYIEKPYRLSHLKNKGIMNYMIGVIGHICYLPRKRLCNKFRRYMSYSERVDEHNVGKLNEQYDLFIAGSDQVWNYKLAGGDMNFFLAFVSDDRKKNSYAASIGLDDIEPSMREVYRQNLATFAHISVREIRAQEILKQLGDIESQVVLDPTLLLDEEEWEAIAREPMKKEEYILAYQLGVSGRFTKYVRTLAKEKRMKVKYIPFPLGGVCASRWMLTIGPAEWVGLFKNASYVVTDSFHGAVFSALFQRQFVIEVNEKNKAVGGRLYEFMRRFGLEDRMLNRRRNILIDEKIDYSKVKLLVKKARKESLDYLRKMIDECKVEEV